MFAGSQCHPLSLDKFTPPSSRLVFSGERNGPDQLRQLGGIMEGRIAVAVAHLHLDGGVAEKGIAAPRIGEVPEKLRVGCTGSGSTSQDKIKHRLGLGKMR